MNTDVVAGVAVDRLRRCLVILLDVVRSVALWYRWLYISARAVHICHDLSGATIAKRAVVDVERRKVGHDTLKCMQHVGQINNPRAEFLLRSHHIDLLASRQCPVRCAQPQYLLTPQLADRFVEVDQAAGDLITIEMLILKRSPWDALLQVLFNPRDPVRKVVCPESGAQCI